ncbi:MAG: hypothetical protein ACREBW_00115 [Candidatus Micrarchaeaceae archaeon]
MDEKEKILEGIKMYDPLWEEHPKVKKIKAQAKAEVEAAKTETEAAKAEARAEAEARIRAEAEVRIRAEAEARMKAEEAIQAYHALRDTVLALVQTRFPELAGLAEQNLERISSPDALKFLLLQVASAANETVARNILHPSAA